MRKLKLEIQLSLDGFATDMDNQTNWLVWDWGSTWSWDKELQDFHIKLHTSSDTIIMGKNMANSGFLFHWQMVARNVKSPQHIFAKAIVDMNKFVFSKRVHNPHWDKMQMLSGDLTEEVNKLKSKKGADILVYGGAAFVSSLITEDLIDEYQFHY